MHLKRSSANGGHFVSATINVLKLKVKRTVDFNELLYEI